MKSLLSLVALGCLANPIAAEPHASDDVVKRTASVVSSGCQWCSTGPWTIDPGCSSYEYAAVASSMLNPPSDIKFDATSFCSEFLRPLSTNLRVINVTAGTTTSTAEIVSLTYFTPATTSTSTSTSTSSKSVATKTSSHLRPTSSSSSSSSSSKSRSHNSHHTRISASTSSAHAGTAATPPAVTPSPKLSDIAHKAIGKGDFTVPEYLEPWYFYGRLDPGCSCLITSALPSILVSGTTTVTIYNVTEYITTTGVYTIYPKEYR